jgi:two-component system NtrC family sensor kinase
VVLEHPGILEVPELAGLLKPFRKGARDVNENGTEHRDHYRGLRRYIITILCLASAIPLALIGGFMYVQFSASVREKVTVQLTSIVTHHKESIERFLQEISSALQVVAELKSFETLCTQEGLKKVFDFMQRQYSYAFEDMGVIDSRGNHVAYVGPYDLLGKNYREAEWFKHTLRKRIFISDVFLGFRQVPHFIIAVTQGSGDYAWILRATVNAARFGTMVENVRLGRTGEAYIVNKEGYYQTRSRMAGSVLGKVEAGAVDLTRFEGVKFWEVTDAEGKRVLRAKTWMKDGDWLLVVQQDADDAFRELYAARNWALVIYLLGAVLIGIVTVLTTRLLVRKIEKIDAKKRLLNEQLIQSSKLASIGELSAGIAHEINNPLAVIGNEAGWIQDLLNRDHVKDITELDRLRGLDELREIRDSLREIVVQAGRCKEITHKLLSFARKMESIVKEVDLHKVLDEVLSMREREASYSNITIVRNYGKNVPLIYSDPSLLRQVFLNLYNNAVDAIQKGGEIRIDTEFKDDATVEIRFSDTGIGIPRENLSKIFDPFFTTKPPGKGTGLGLSICHGIIQKLGGEISVESQVGKGTTFTISLPVEKVQGGQ